MSQQNNIDPASESTSDAHAVRPTQQQAFVEDANRQAADAANAGHSPSQQFFDRCNSESGVGASTIEASASAELHEEPQTVLQRLGRLLTHPRAPVVVLIVLAIGAAGFIGHRLFPGLTGRPDIVVFDPVRFVNAQRAAASILATQPNADLSLMMTQVAKSAEAVIQEEARGAVVLIRQAVVVPDNLRDITTDVLNRFGLPTGVPTVTNDIKTMSLENLAPTDSAFSPDALREDYRMELQSKAHEAALEREKQTGQQALIP